MAALGFACALSACAAQSAQSKPLGNNKHHIQCKSSLRACLQKAEELCPDVSYDVLAARDRRKYTGVEPAVVQHRSSEAVVKCGSKGISLFNEPDLVQQVQDSSKGQEKKPGDSKQGTTDQAACTPGASQACVGVAGCKGGQACLPDGSGFGPCQCAPATEEAPASEPADTDGTDAEPAEVSPVEGAEQPPAESGPKAAPTKASPAAK